MQSRFISMKPIQDFLELIKFEHTVFALPFAYLGMLLAAKGLPSLYEFIWITVAMASARTVAMATNRLVDQQFDARNPRTINRPLIIGTISLTTAWAGTVVAIVILVIAAWQLGPLPTRLLPIALLCLLGYSYTKRFTWLSHFALGFTDGLAPLGAWVAIRSSLFSGSDVPAWILVAIVTLWIGGFDLIYACQDVEFDRREGLKSIPARFGISASLVISSICHLLTIPLLVWMGLLMHLSFPYWVGLLIVIVLLIWEHRLVNPNDLSKLDIAFFNINGYISITMFFSILAALLLVG